MSDQINNVIVISDTHSGCRLALCPPRGVPLDDGGRYTPSALQRKLWAYWREFWGEWVPWATKGEPYAVVHNGDSTDGVHHGSTTQISHNLEDQESCAYELLAPIVDKCDGRFYMVRGTPAHVGPSGIAEERLAKRLGAKRNDVHQYARHELWMNLGGSLVHFAHHVGNTSSMAYETSAVMKELVELYADSARWRRRRPDCVVRSHRHRNIEIKIPTDQTYGIAFVTPAWQLKTPFCYKIAGARVTQPQIGGSLIRRGDRELYTVHFVRDIRRPAAVKP